jgi:hypothetical protein
MAGSGAAELPIPEKEDLLDAVASELAQGSTSTPRTAAAST